MPHKHKRKRDGDDKHFDLPPSKVAKPLNAYEKIEKKHHKGAKPKSQPQKPRRSISGSYEGDDTPRAFARLVAVQDGKRQRSGLDDGARKSKKKSRQTTEQEITASVPQLEFAEKLKILPGERLSEFAARVNQSLPVGGLSRKGKAVEGEKQRQTKTEKRLHRMYAEWREQDAKRKEKEEEFKEEQEERDEELQTEYGGQSIRLEPEGKKAKRKRMLTEAGDKEDPWAVLKTKREAPKGLHDVVQAPPELKVVPKEKFKVRDGAKIEVANVPGKSGSLKRREELGEARKEVIERYRAMMKGKGGL
ncbi:hypothetical protein AC579_10032 [Pseudocercospora musae]|uniref:Urease accessory protein UreD n=1 Tax=Pseudocercospora musae TaxID=113226 RepID=A0A139IH12_9PEZI|nr:hypothetical protein AC579_10032 [Pseudocercospora musae]